MTPRDTLYSFDDYLKIIETYDPKTLDAAVAAADGARVGGKGPGAGQPTGRRGRQGQGRGRRPQPPAPTAACGFARQLADGEPLRSRTSDRYLAKAVAAGKVAFVDESAATGDDDLLKLAQLIGPMARERLGDSETAFQIWQGAAERIAAAEPKAECEIAAADIAINDLLETGRGEVAAGGGGQAARHEPHRPDRRQAPARLGRLLRRHGRRRRGPQGVRRGRAERRLRHGRWSRARPSAAPMPARPRSSSSRRSLAGRPRSFRRGSGDFPTEKIEGYLTLLYARYWAGRGKYAQAIAQAEQLLAVNRDSPYVDQLLLLAADSEMRRGRKDRALATLHSLVKDYPGSPLVPLAKKNIEALEGEEK